MDRFEPFQTISSCFGLFGPYYQFLAVPGCFQTVLEHFGMFQAVSGSLDHFELFWIISYLFRMFWVVLGHFKMFWTISYRFVLFDAILGRFRLFWAISNRSGTVQTVQTVLGSFEPF